MDYFFLTKTPLFQGVSTQELPAMLSCLEAKQQSFQKDARIYRAGDTVSALGLILSGSVRIESVISGATPACWIWPVPALSLRKPTPASPRSP